MTAPIEPAEVLAIAARLAFQSYLLTGGSGGRDARDSIEAGDIETLKRFRRDRDDAPKHVHHAVQAAMDAYGAAILAYSHSGGRSETIRPPWAP